MAASSCHLFRPLSPNIPLTSSLPAPVPSLLRSLNSPATWSKARPLLLSTTATSQGARSSSVLLFSMGYNVQVLVGEDEPDEVLLRRFRREVTKAGVILECKRRRFFENKQEERKRKAREAGRRNRRRRYGFRSSSSSSKSDTLPKQAVEDVDDNWDMPEEDLPY